MSESSSKFPAQQDRQVFEYLFLIPLNGIHREVTELKDHLFHLVGGNYPGYKSTPHITLFNIASSSQMDLVLERLNVTWMPPFQIKVKGFDYYEHGQKSRSIYLNIEKKQTIVYLQSWLSDFFLLRKHAFDPHITIGRTLPVNTFEKVWSDIRSMRFERAMNCNKLIILKRRQQTTHPEKWERYREILLGSN